MNARTPIRTLARMALPLLVGLGLASGTPARADVRLPAIFSDHLVLQADVPVRIWGWASPAENITVRIAGQAATTAADAAGAWQVMLKPLPASAAATTLNVQGRNQLMVGDVLIGEVWLGSGQSNMELRTSQAQNFAREKAAANFPQIRQFTVRRNARPDAITEVTGEWHICSPATVGDFSAALYFFGRELHQELRCPVGLINSSWGATPIQTWMPIDAVRSAPGYAALLEKRKQEVRQWPEQERKILANIRAWEAEAKTNPAAAQRPRPWNPGPPDAGQQMPAGTYQGMIHGLTPFRIRGVLWYQGENNAREGAAGAVEYADLLTRLITSWRAAWQLPDLPFLFVQLPNFAEPRDATHESWAYFREAQASVLALPHTGMAVTIDVGEPDFIHPHNKQAVGHRLALLALADVYQRPIAAHAPMFDACRIQGNEAHLTFKHATGGLVPHGEPATGFALAGSDRVWHPADVRPAGDDMVLSSPAVTTPVAARYGWANNPAGNFYNRAGLPLAPFRTDNW